MRVLPGRGRQYLIRRQPDFASPVESEANLSDISFKSYIPLRLPHMGTIGFTAFICCVCAT